MTRLPLRAAILAVAVSLAALACSPSDLAATVGTAAGKPTPAPSGPHCAELYLRAQISPKPVAGLWACLAKPVQDTFIQAGDPAGDNALAVDLGLSENYWYIGREHTGGYVYEVRATSGSKSAAITIVVYLDADGKVANSRPTRSIEF